jgi:hypothetical protein
MSDLHDRTHEQYEIEPGLETLLRRNAARYEMTPGQDQRIRARLGLTPAHDVGTAAAASSHAVSGDVTARTLPVLPPREAQPMMLAEPQSRRRQWIEFALGAAAIVLVGVLLVAIFRGLGEDPASQPGISASPEPTPAATATATIELTPQVAPTPDEMGMYRGITLEQARAIVPFPVLVPGVVPEGLDAPEITVVESPPLATGGRTYRVEMFFGVSGSEAPRRSIQVLQLDPRGTLGTLPDGESTPITFNGVAVERRSGTNAAGTPLLAYYWRTDEAQYQVFAMLEPPVSEYLLEQLVIAILTPEATTPDAAQAQRAQERQERIPFAVSPDACDMTGWNGPDFRIRQQEAAAYFLDGAGLSLGTTHGVITTGQNRIDWLARGELSTGDQLRGPTTITITRNDGSGESLDLALQQVTQVDTRLIPDAEVTRAWTSRVTFPEEGCWSVRVELGELRLEAVVYVYPS